MDSFKLKKRKPADRLKEAVERRKRLSGSPFTPFSKQDRLPTYSDPTIRRAFAEFDLDPNDPWDRFWLLRDLCEIHFYEKPRRGRKGKWNDEEGLLLVEVVEAYIAERKRGKGVKPYKAKRGKGTVDAIRTAQYLHKDWLGTYSVPTLEGRFYQARRTAAVKAADTKKAVKAEVELSERNIRDRKK